MIDERITPQVTDEMRRVLSEHYWFAMTWDEIVATSDRLVLKGIGRRYPGGVDGFIRDLEMSR